MSFSGFIPPATCTATTTVIFSEMKPERSIKPDLIFKPDKWVGKLNSKPRKSGGAEKKGRSRCISHSSYLQKICLDSNLDYFIYCDNSVPLESFN